MHINMIIQTLSLIDFFFGTGRILISVYSLGLFTKHITVDFVWMKLISLCTDQKKDLRLVAAI